jgi:hypothetical protein
MPHVSSANRRTKIAASARAHEHPEGVRLQRTEELEHRLVHQVDVRHSELRLLDRLQRLKDLPIKLLRRSPLPRTTERLQQRADRFRLLRRDTPKELHVPGEYRHVRPPLSQLQVRPDLLARGAKHKIELRRQRLLDHKVPSPSNVAIRSATSTNLDPGVLADDKKSRVA